MAEPFRTTRRVEFCDTDMAGIVHFSNYFRYMESAEVDFLRSLDLSVTMLGDHGEKLGLPRVSATCDYLKPALFGDLLDVTVAVEQIGRKSVSYRFEFSKAGQTVARGRISAVCCRWTADGKLESVEVPSVVRVKLEPFIIPGERGA
jgi:YbgC/YbaW family acyl-CoA thioester hydrolase